MECAKMIISKGLDQCSIFVGAGKGQTLGPFPGRFRFCHMIGKPFSTLASDSSVHFLLSGSKPFGFRSWRCLSLLKARDTREYRPDKLECLYIVTANTPLLQEGGQVAKGGRGLLTVDVGLPVLSDYKAHDAIGKLPFYLD